MDRDDVQVEVRHLVADDDHRDTLSGERRLLRLADDLGHGEEVRATAVRGRSSGRSPRWHHERVAGASGLIDRNATHWSSRQTNVPGISPSMIRENIVGIISVAARDAVAHRRCSRLPRRRRGSAPPSASSSASPSRPLPIRIEHRLAHLGHRRRAAACPCSRGRRRSPGCRGGPPPRPTALVRAMMARLGRRVVGRVPVSRRCRSIEAMFTMAPDRAGSMCRSAARHAVERAVEVDPDHPVPVARRSASTAPRWAPARRSRPSIRAAMLAMLRARTSGPVVRRCRRC